MRCPCCSSSPKPRSDRAPRPRRPQRRRPVGRARRRDARLDRGGVGGRRPEVRALLARRADGVVGPRSSRALRSLRRGAGRRSRGMMPDTPAPLAGGQESVPPIEAAAPRAFARPAEWLLILAVVAVDQLTKEVDPPRAAALERSHPGDPGAARSDARSEHRGGVRPDERRRLSLQAVRHDRHRRRGAGGDRRLRHAARLSSSGRRGRAWR